LFRRLEFLRRPPQIGDGGFLFFFAFALFLRAFPLRGLLRFDTFLFSGLFSSDYWCQPLVGNLAR
jgi:hypothetical protein